MKKIIFILILINSFLWLPYISWSEEVDFVNIIMDVIIKNINKLPSKQVAVMNFTEINGQETEEGKLLAQQITTRLIEKGVLKVIERQQLDKVIKEQELKASGITETQDQDIGKVLNVDAIIVGTITQINEDEEINARMIDVKTGEILCVANAKKQLRLREKEFENLPADVKEKIKNEYAERRKLKTKNPELFKIVDLHKRQLWKLKENNPALFQKVLKTIEIMEKLKNENPKMFLLVTEGPNSPRIKRIKKEHPEEFEKLVKIRKILEFIIKHSPAYKDKIKFDRQEILSRLKEK